MSTIAAIAGADAGERMRRFAFLIIVAAALYAGYIYIPGPNAAYSTIAINEHRGAYNAPYVGVAIALLTNAFLSLAGFFFVRGSVERDRELHVDGIVAASPVSRIHFVLGKWLSNLAVLSAVAAISFLAAIGMQQWYAEDRAFDMMAYVVPYVLLTVPAMAFVSAAAIVFDVIPFLRGIIGGIVYVGAIWMALLILPMPLQSSDFSKHPAFDPLGVSPVITQLYAAEQTAFPREKHETNVMIGGDAIPDGALARFRFDGMQWSALLVGERAAWFVLSLVLVLAISPLFDRFRRESATGSRRRQSANISRYLPDIPLVRTVRAEVVLLVNGTSVWWLLGAAALALLTAIVPLTIAAGFILPLALIWPLERVSALGARERQHDVFDIFAATRGFTWRNVVAQWIAGTLVASVIAGGFIVRLIAGANPDAAIAVIASIAATVAIALMLGSITGSPRAFQALYLVAWYLGPIQHLPGIDVAVQSQAHPIATAAVALVLGLGGIAVAISQRTLALR